MPWSAIVVDQGTYILSRYWPKNVTFKEPSRLTNPEVTSILEFWRDRQVTQPTDIFKVKQWIESDGSLQVTVPKAAVASQGNKRSTKKAQEMANEGEKI